MVVPWVGVNEKENGGRVLEPNAVEADRLGRIRESAGEDKYLAMFVACQSITSTAVGASSREAEPRGLA
jgi:hypothetical protein